MNDATYRYTLTRDCDMRGGALPTLTIIGVNPSTATDTQDDPTIRRCIRFATDARYGYLQMLNLFAFRSTDVRRLAAADDPVGPHNDARLLNLCIAYEGTVVSWDRGVLDLALGATSRVAVRLAPSPAERAAASA